MPEWLDNFIASGFDKKGVEATDLIALAGGAAAASGVFDKDQPQVGYQGGIPEYTAVRDQVPYDYANETRRPGSLGRRYFSDTVYAQDKDLDAPTQGDAQATVDAQIADLLAGGQGNTAEVTTLGDKRRLAVENAQATVAADQAAAAEQAAIDQAAADAAQAAADAAAANNTTTPSGGGLSLGGTAPASDYTSTRPSNTSSVSGSGWGFQPYTGSTATNYVERPPEANKLGHYQNTAGDYVYGELPTDRYYDRTGSFMIEGTAPVREKYPSALGGVGFAKGGMVNGYAGGGIVQAMNALRDGGSLDAPQIPQPQQPMPPQMPQPQQPMPPQIPPQGRGIAQAGQYMRGATDGMGDKRPALINGQQDAALSDGEVVVPADVVSHLGNGNSDAGNKQLQNMMARIRQARTGNPQQGERINPNDFMVA
jgi:hypothetical protein